MIIQTQEYRDLLKAQIDTFTSTEALARMNKRYTIKAAVIVVQGLQTKYQIICGNFSSFRSSRYYEDAAFHPETTVLDMYSSDLDNITLYIAKINIKGESLESRPCRKCMLQIRECPEIQSIVYRNEKSRVVEEVMK